MRGVAEVRKVIRLMYPVPVVERSIQFSLHFSVQRLNGRQSRSERQSWSPNVALTRERRRRESGAAAGYASRSMPVPFWFLRRSQLVLDSLVLTSGKKP